MSDLFSRLNQIAHNFWWSWQPEVMAIFRDLDPELWNEVNHNPILLLRRLEQETLTRRSREMSIESRVLYALRRLSEYLSGEGTYGKRNAGPILARPVAYLSAEFGIHESLPVYAGGLGILAGDHLKAASDLGIPLVGVGLFYVEGYFRQQIDEKGHQKEFYGETDVNHVPMRRALAECGRALTVSVETPSGPLLAGIWTTRVGRNSLILLDSNVEGNSEEDSKLTARLYGGDDEVRLRQEILLGVGGLRALDALGIHPSVVHMNEGHSALASIEGIRRRMKEDGLSFEDARRDVSLRTVFTTHTPVEAGHDRFEPELAEAHLGTLREDLGLTEQEFLALGRVNPDDDEERFCMTVLALKTSRTANGVSSLHGHVSRRMWRNLWPGRPEREIPIGHITNGVHVLSWLAPTLYRFYERVLGPRWAHRMHDPDVWTGILEIDDGELWEAHQVMRSRLVDFVRRRASDESILEPKSLTLGFARRFATYKRATLMFSELDRLDELVNSEERPVQILFSGKAHPKDEPGKAFIKRIHDLSRDPRFAGKLAFVDDYDIGVGRALVHGVDAWVNTPRRPMEACGTSGQKVVLNGGLNISILDGWWAEAYDGTNGFAVGNDRCHADPDVQDERDAEALYQTLRDQVVPAFYERDESGVPREWVRRMKRALVTLAWRFSADRMLIDYLNRAYLPAAGGLSSSFD